MLSAAGVLSKCGVGFWCSTAVVGESSDVSQTLDIDRVSLDSGVRCLCSPGVATDELATVAESHTLSAGKVSSNSWR